MRYFTLLLLLLESSLISTSALLSHTDPPRSPSPTMVGLKCDTIPLKTNCAKADAGRATNGTHQDIIWTKQRPSANVKLECVMDCACDRKHSSPGEPCSGKVAR